MTVFGPFLWPYFLTLLPPEQPAKNLFLEAAVLESSSSRKTSWTSVESVALPGLSPLNLCPICVALGYLECGPWVPVPQSERFHNFLRAGGRGGVGGGHECKGRVLGRLAW